MTKAYHSCYGNRELRLMEGKCPSCGMLVQGGKPGKPHVCGKDESFCSKCEV